MNKNGRWTLFAGCGMLIAFALWTWLILYVDVRPLGVNGTKIGLASINTWFHELTGVRMNLYEITDWLGLVPVVLCASFGALGLIQLVRRRRLFSVDADILLLGVYYIMVILAYLLFETVPINYRPVLIDGRMEASFPSSTTLLMLSVMPTLCYQANRRIKSRSLCLFINHFALLFSSFMVIARLISGVHWLSDIVGAVLLGRGLYLMYRCSVEYTDKKSNH